MVRTQYIFNLHKKYLLIFFGTLLFGFHLNAQDGFRFKNESDRRESVSFKLINNLIILPVEINGKELSFILDTGVNKTIIFNLTENDSIGLANTEKILLRGLGGGDAVEAILSRNNKFKIKDLISYNEAIYVILKDFFDLSSKMGTTIHGIIGYNLLRNFIVKINYKTKRIHFYNPNKYKLKKCRRCEILPMQFYVKKPYIDVEVQLDTIGNKLTKVKMLIDSGGSDAIWLFENSKKNIKTPKLFFNDILGEGLSGTIYGNRSRIPKLKIGKFEIEAPTVSFLDSISTKNARSLKERNGSIGGNILKRFKVWLDYRNNKIMLKKNASFKDDFNYNMSGLDVVYSGKQLVREKTLKNNVDAYNQSAERNNTISFVTNYTYKFKPSYKIKTVVPNSPASKAGLKENDVILKINGKSSYSFTLNEIFNKFQEKENKKMKITVKRNGEVITYEFRLRKRI